MLTPGLCGGNYPDTSSVKNEKISQFWTNHKEGAQEAAKQINPMQVEFRNAQLKCVQIGIALQSYFQNLMSSLSSASEASLLKKFLNSHHSGEDLSDQQLKNICSQYLESDYVKASLELFFLKLAGENQKKGLEDKENGANNEKLFETLRTLELKENKRMGETARRLAGMLQELKTQ